CPAGPRPRSLRVKWRPQPMKADIARLLGSAPLRANSLVSSTQIEMDRRTRIFWTKRLILSDVPRAIAHHLAQHLLLRPQQTVVRGFIPALQRLMVARYPHLVAGVIDLSRISRRRAKDMTPSSGSIEKSLRRTAGKA